MVVAASYSAQQSLKEYEDFWFASSEPSQNGYSAFGLFDGHHGDTVSRFLASRLLPELESRLPACPALDPQHPESAYAAAEQIRRAVAAAFLAVAVAVQQQQPAGGRQAAGLHEPSCGSTASLVLQWGPLLTVANVGNSMCVLDDGSTSIEVSADHKIGNNEDEDARLDAAGARIARLRFDLTGPAGAGEEGVGPLRLWPGGLHMSRAIGDTDCGPLVLPYPYIQQLWLPQRAARLIMASGSVWACFEVFHKAAGALRGVSLQHAASALLNRVQRRRQARHDYADATVLVVDFVPEAGPNSLDFKSQVRLDRLSRSSVCSNSSNSSSRAAGLPRRLSAPKLLQLGVVRPAGHQQQQARRGGLFRHSTGTTPASWTQPASLGGAPSGARARQQQQQQQQPVAQSPAKLSSSPETQHPQQQQQPRRLGSFVSGLRSALCIAPGATAADCQADKQAGRVLEQVSSFGSSTAADSTSSQATSTTLASTSTGGSSWRWARSWRRSSSSSGSNGNGVGGSKAATQPQQQRDCAGASTARTFARVDTWRAYSGTYVTPLDRQLAVLDASLARQRSVRTHNGQEQQQAPRLQADSMRAAAAATPMRCVRSAVDLCRLDQDATRAAPGPGAGLDRGSSLSGTFCSDASSSCNTSLLMPLSD